MRESSVPGENCVRNQLLVDEDKILLPPLHIKFGSMKNLVKDTNKPGKCFEYLREKFPKISDAELKRNMFIGPKIPEIINDDLLEHALMETEKSEWPTFKAACLNFLGNVKTEKYKEILRTC